MPAGAGAGGAGAAEACGCGSSSGPLSSGPEAHLWELTCASSGPLGEAFRCMRRSYAHLVKLKEYEYVEGAMGPSSSAGRSVRLVQVHVKSDEVFYGTSHVTGGGGGGNTDPHATSLPHVKSDDATLLYAPRQLLSRRSIRSAAKSEKPRSCWRVKRRLTRPPSSGRDVSGTLSSGRDVSGTLRIRR